MLNNYMGILCLNEKDSNIKSLTQNRPLASIPLGGRYRIIDFILSFSRSLSVTLYAANANKDIEHKNV